MIERHSGRAKRGPESITPELEFGHGLANTVFLWLWIPGSALRAAPE
jgi:hypothetical protein